jgi:preprotein translocase subunit SecG
MLIFIIAVLTLLMILDCAVLIGLVLIQLPKKDTGGGLAFGGGATDALFGAGSGNVMTKLTKYAAGIFFALAVVLSVLQSKYHSAGSTAFGAKLAAPPAPMMPMSAPSSAPATSPAQKPELNLTSTNMATPPPAEATNVPATPATTPASTNKAPAGK